MHVPHRPAGHGPTVRAHHDGASEPHLGVAARDRARLAGAQDPPLRQDEERLDALVARVPLGPELHAVARERARGAHERLLAPFTERRHPRELVRRPGELGTPCGQRRAIAEVRGEPQSFRVEEPDADTVAEEACPCLHVASRRVALDLAKPSVAHCPQDRSPTSYIGAPNLLSGFLSK